MSLINDALQRAKQAQQSNPEGVAQLQLRPADTEPRPSRSRSTALLWGWIGCLILAAAVPFAVMQARTPKSPEDVPSPMAAVELNRISMPSEAALQPSPAAASQVPEPAAAPDLGEQPVVTAAAPVVAPPPAPRLQAIVYSVAHPSAIVSGKTVYIGSRISEFQVASITPDSVTLVSSGQTNVVRLGLSE